MHSSECLRSHLKRLAIILGYCVGTAFLFGGTGFVVGFFGPLLIGLLIGSEPNQGPLWGIFILGPGGVILGFFFGAFVGYKKTRNKSRQSAPVHAGFSQSLSGDVR